MSHNGRVLESLLAASAEGKLHHAYIFSGPESPAKMETAERLAASFSTGNGLFGGASDGALERIRRGNHPDFLRIAPHEALISVDDVRILPKALSYPPLEASRRVVAIEGAECMNSQAANAILKILEEPPAHTLFFLLCRHPAELLATIVSRCQVWSFAPLAEKELLEALQGREVAEPEVVAAWSEGSLARAEALLQTEGALVLRREACERLLGLWEASPRVPHETFRFVEGLEPEERCEIALGAWELLLRDLAFTAAGARAAELRFPEFFSRLSSLSGGKNQELVDEAAAKTAIINRFRVYRQFNGNLRLDMAALAAGLQLFCIGKALQRG
jgi:DNA polymerase-3 subunit delta'